MTTAKLRTGAEMPLVGLGTWQAAPGVVAEAVKAAIKSGYRHIDCAHVYGNEAEIGAAFAELFAAGDVKREELFVTSKLWNTCHKEEHVLPALETTLKNLQLEYLDLYLIHWPHAFRYSGPDNFPKNEDGSVQYDLETNFTATWKGMEAGVAAGMVKAIGLSNFNSKQIGEVCAMAAVPPAVLQVESHPYLGQEKLIAFARSKGIVVTAYSPLGSPDSSTRQEGDPKLMQDPQVKELAGKYGKSEAAILIRFQVQRGVVTIPKSVTPSRIASNLEVFDFELEAGDMAALLQLNRPWRGCGLARDSVHPLFPFHEDF